jgi:hypothetical protein
MTTQAETSAVATPPAASTSASEPATAAEGSGPNLVFKLPKKKRKYSKGLRGIQLLQRAVMKSTARMTSAVATGADSFKKRSDESSRKRRDGAIQDAMKNWARATSKAMKEASGLPRDMIKPLATRRNGRRMRNMARWALSMTPFGRR